MNRTYIIAFWSLSPISSQRFCMDYFSSSLKQYGDIQFLNCGDRQDRRTLKLLHQADLVVIPLRQSHREISDFICKNALHFSKYIYLIIDYVPDSEFDLAKISFEFRIPPGQLACIPYNPEYSRAAQMFPPASSARQNSLSILKREHSDSLRELQRAQKIILQALGF